jgi:hypothetical protein
MNRSLLAALILLILILMNLFKTYPQGTSFEIVLNSDYDENP